MITSLPTRCALRFSGKPFSWAAWWASLVSATVEQAAPTKIVMTFGKGNISLVAADFTIAGKTITLLERDATNKILTLTVSVAVAYGDSFVITFVKTGGTAAVINNVLYSMLLTSTGNGTGVSTITLTVSASLTLTLGANAKFYTDAGGTLGESSTWTVTTGAARTMYLKCTTGTATMSFSDITKLTNWGAWTSATNAASLSGDVSKMIFLTYLRVEGSNTLSGSVAALTSLTYLRVEGSNTLSGSVAALPSLTSLYVTGSNILSGSVEALPSLTSLYATGSNTLSGSVEALTLLTSLYVFGSNTLSGSVAALTSLTYLRVEGSNTLSGSVEALTLLTSLYVTGSNTLSGDLNPVVSDLTYCVLNSCGMVDYTAGATWGNAVIIINPSAGYGYSATEIDNMLIDMAASVALIGKTITLKGSSAARTAASDAAVAILIGAGRNNTVLTN